jgi:glutathione S-transferase
MADLTLTTFDAVADILMADALRLLDRFERLKGHSACRAYVARATARPALFSSGPK